jgi:hypothetical protein
MSEFVDPDQVKLGGQDDLWGFAQVQHVFAVDYWLAKRRPCRIVQDAAGGPIHAQS